MQVSNSYVLNYLYSNGFCDSVERSIHLKEGRIRTYKISVAFSFNGLEKNPPTLSTGSLEQTLFFELRQDGLITYILFSSEKNIPIETMNGTLFKAIADIKSKYSKFFPLQGHSIHLITTPQSRYCVILDIEKRTARPVEY